MLFLLLAARAGIGWSTGAHHDVQGIINRLQPGPEFLIQGAGEQAQSLPHSDHRPADGHAIIAALEDFAQACGDRQQGLAGAGLSITCHQGDIRVEQGIEEALLPEIEWPDGLAFGDFDGFRHLQADETSLAGMAGGHGLFFTDLQQDVFVHGQAGGLVRRQGDDATAGKALQFHGIDRKALQVVAGDIPDLRLVIQIVLTGDADGAGLELKVEVFGDEDHGRGVLLAHHEGAGEDAVVHLVHRGKEVHEFGQGRRDPGMVLCAERREADAAAASGRDAGGHRGAALLEDF